MEDWRSYTLNLVSDWWGVSLLPCGTWSTSQNLGNFWWLAGVVEVVQHRVNFLLLMVS